MSHATIDVCFWVALATGLPGGALVMFLWARKILPALTRSIEGEKRVDLDSVAMKTLFYGFPGLIAMLVCAFPAIYFGHLRKQFAYCVEVVRVNPGITADDEDLRQRCGDFQVDELFRVAGK